MTRRARQLLAPAPDSGLPLPVVNQIQLSPAITRAAEREFHSRLGIVTESYSPLGGSGGDLLSAPILVQLAEKYDKTPAQVVLRWAIQRGTSIVPKSTRVERLRENLDLFDFELNGEEMAAISGLNRNRRFNDPGVFCESAFNTFFPIYE